MMSKRFWGMGLLLGVALSARADLEGPSHPNAIGLELLGRGAAYSIFYDRMATDTLAIGVGMSIGLGGSIGTSAGALAFPIYMNFYMSGADSRPFISGGATLSTGPLSLSSVSSQTGTQLYANVGFGYEYRGTTGFLFRVTPYIFIGSSVAPWVGMSFGYAM